MCQTEECLLYADDTCLTYVHEDLSELTTNVNNKFHTFLDWCKINRMSLNPAKTEYKIINKLHTFLDWCKFNRMSLNPAKTKYKIISNKIIQTEPCILMGNQAISRK